MKQLYSTLFLVYLFSYVQISPAMQQNNPNYLNYDDDSSMEYLESYEEDPIDNRLPNSEESNEYKIDKRSAEPEIPLSRQKRFFGFFVAVIAGLISATAGGVISNEINKAIDRGNGRSGGFTTKESAIAHTINQNYYSAVQFKNRLARVSPEAARAIVISRYGFNCDISFCRRFGTGHHSIGICSSQICSCSNGIPINQACGGGTVFDPMYKVCNWAYNVQLCGA